MDAEITHRQALAALDARELNALKATADRPGLVRLAAHLGLLCLTGAAVLAAPSSWLWWPAAVAHGIVLVFLFAPEHEAIHGTAFRSAWLNAVVAEIAGFLLLLPPRRFRYFHFAHHRHTQDPEHDPELVTPKPEGWPAYLWRLTGWSYWSGQVRGLATAALGRDLLDYVPAGGRRRVVAEARAYMAGYGAVAAASIAAGSWLAVALWVVPALLGQPFLRAYLLAEHTACPLVPDMLRNTRTTFTGPVIALLAWNMPHHTAHHAVPQVPFHRLPRLTALLKARLVTTADGYVAAHRQIVRGFSRAP